MLKKIRAAYGKIFPLYVSLLEEPTTGHKNSLDINYDNALPALKNVNYCIKQELFFAPDLQNI